MSDHVVDRIADYLEGRLTPEVARAVEAHLDACAECAADVEFARALQTAAMRQGLTHIRPGRIIALATDPAGATLPEEQHLMECRSCREELDWVRRSSASDLTDGGSSPADSGLHPTRARKSSRSLIRGWGLGLATVAAAVLIVLFVIPRGSIEPERAAGLAHVAPIPVNITRSSAPPGSFEEVRMKALEAYRDADYDLAVELLGQAVDERPDATELILYLGSAAMLTGDYGSATRHLQVCIQRASNDALRDEALWQLANAELAGGKVDAARDTLKRVRDAGGNHAEDATRLLSELNG